MDRRSKTETERRPSKRWPIVVLLAILGFDVWYRAHTFAPELPAAVGMLWPTARGPSEPLDCDETAYAYMGHRMTLGDVLYRDLAEHKPPLGYWIYELAVALGGYREMAIRLMAIPFVAGTIALLWWLGLRLAGPACGCIAAAVYAVVSTDPYLYGNGSNMEHFMNLFSVAALALFVLGWTGRRRWAIAAAGACVGASALVKQVAIVPAAVFAVAVLLKPGEEDEARPAAARAVDGLAFGVGLAAATGLAALVLWLQGAGASAIDEIFRYGPALATDTLPEPNAPSGLIRWLTGNAAPDGRLPWPFGRTDYLVWWGTGSWPIWLATALATAYVLAARGVSRPRRLVAAWTVAAALQVILPQLYWQHYYLLVTPGIALMMAIGLADSLRPLGRVLNRETGLTRPAPGAIAASLIAAGLLSLAVAATVVLQVRCYLLVPPQELTVRYKGGGQWVALRMWGEELDRRRSVWAEPRLYIWGYQAPLHFYGKLDGVTRYFFVDNLLRDQAERDHPLIRPRIDEIMASLRARPPGLIFVGYPPFPALRAFLRERYRPSSLIPGMNGMGLWVDGEHLDAFEAAGSRGRAR